MAKSGKGQREVYKVPRNMTKKKSENPKWLVPTFSTLLVLGPVWIVVYYVSRAEYPLDIGNWNLVIGFAFLATAMVLLTRWK